MKRKAWANDRFRKTAEASKRQMAKHFGKPTPAGEGVHPNVTPRQREISRKQFEEAQRLRNIAVSRPPRGDPDQ